jgi:hypothetical protein
MADGKDPGPSLVGNGFIWLLLAAAGALLFRQEQPLQGSRPAAIEAQVHEHDGSLQDVQARLWQDPLDAVRKMARAQANPAALRVGHSLNEIGRKLLDRRPVVAAVLLPGAPYAGDTEFRRRIRYAVLAGLNAERYVPEDEEHLGYFTPDEDRDVPLPPAIPFEQFRTIEGARVLLLWLDEDMLVVRDKPLASLSRLLVDLQKAGNGNPAGLKVIGPAASSTLRDMRDEFRTAREADAKAVPPPGLEFFDYAASVDESLLVQTDTDAQLFKAPVFYRTVASDGALAHALIGELKQRGVGPTLTSEWWQFWRKRPGTIALVSEWDTFYGQSLPETFIRCIRSQAPCANSPSSPETAASVVQFSYMRGLDGELPRSGGSAKKDADPGDGGDAASSDTKKDAAKARPIERAEGQSQFDYLRRLVNQITLKNEELVENYHERIRAIGVLGSDVYDKLLVLQALRADFPDAIFFTTDLDARFWHPNELRSTRNLIVASSFGLRLRDELQGSIPPFRDTYQTAAFLAARLALKGVPSSAAGPGETTRGGLAGWLSAPALFQIGRTGPFALPHPTGAQPQALGDGVADAERNACAADIRDCAGIQPPIPPIYPRFHGWGARLSATAIIAAVLLGLSLALRSVRERLQDAFAKGISPYSARRIALAVSLALAIGFALSATWHWSADTLTEYGSGEPIVLLEGISLWPTIAFRMLICLLCLWLIQRSFRRVDESVRDTAERLLLHPMRERLNDALDAAVALDPWGKYVSYFSYQLAPAAAGTGSPVAERDHEIAGHWAKYLYKGRPHVRAWRVSAYVLVALLVGAILAGVADPPSIPHRGTVSDWTYWAMSWVSGLPALYLTCLVIDTTLIFCLFVRELRQAHCIWPSETLALFEGQLGLRRAQVTDWINLQFIAQRSQAIMGFIYYPFLIIALMILSRNPVFDNFSLIPMQVLYQALVLAILIGCMIWLQRTAEAARAEALQNLREQFMAEKAAGGGRTAMLEALISGAENLREGAFTPMSHQPLVRAMLLPLSGFGGSQLLQYLLPGL